MNAIAGTPSSASKLRLLRDIRYFEFDGMPAPQGPAPDYLGALFPSPAGASSLGLRLACKAEELGISIGQASHLYLCFTRAIAPGAVEACNYQYRNERWAQFVLVGLPHHYAGLDDQQRLTALLDASCAALHWLAPTRLAEISTLRRGILEHGDALRVRIHTKPGKLYHICIEHTVATHPAPSSLYVRIKASATGAETEFKLAELGRPDDARALVGRVAIRDGVLIIHPKPSWRASLDAAPYNTPLTVDLRQSGARQTE
ncbi:hypothetical protein [Chitinimonas sp.]|uniref:hypothetical protein n=1 Tax=Chitinimonas sp. TaxID=1934313 RepID=UPI0035B30C48